MRKNRTDTDGAPSGRPWHWRRRFWRLLAPRGAAGEKHLTVEVVHGDGSVREFALDTDEACLGPALVAGGVVEDNQGPYGLYILTADGETAREAAQEWWRITRDGEAVNTGAGAPGSWRCWAF